jgi:hypothetical protein
MEIRISVLIISTQRLKGFFKITKLSFRASRLCFCIMRFSDDAITSSVNFFDIFSPIKISLCINLHSVSFLRFFSSAKILDGDWSISEITVYDWLIFAEEKNPSKRESSGCRFPQNEHQKSDHYPDNTPIDSLTK